MSDLLTWALYYAGRGWPAFPLVPKGKLPVIAKRDGGNGLHDATTDVDVIKAWWQRYPTANIGLRTGVAFDVLDIDSWDALHALNAYRANRPMTFGPEVVTGWGWHLYHSPSGAGNRAGLRGGLLPGVDFRGVGGYVVAPPSIHGETGRRYEWAPGAGPDEALEPLPDWLRELVLPPRPAPASTATPMRPVGRGRVEAYAERALESELGRVALAPVGGRNDQLNRSAFALGQLVAGGALPLDLVVERLVEAAARAGLSGHEVEATIASGLRNGARQPRQVPA